MHPRYKTLAAEAHYFRILANPKRLQIIQLLLRRELTVSDMERETGIRQANLSQHLMILRQARIVSAEHKGKKVYYHLSCVGLVHIQATLSAGRIAGRTSRTQKRS